MTLVRDELDGPLSEIPEIVRHPGRSGRGPSVSFGGREIAHFHDEQRLDVRLTGERIRQHLVERPFAERVRTRGPSAK